MAEMWEHYDAAADAFDRDRSRAGMEAGHLARIAAALPDGGGTVLDLGCGGGEPIARYFIDRGHRVTALMRPPP